MKKILALLLISSIFFSCKKDEEPNLSNSLVGTWNATEVTVSTYIPGTPTPITDTETITGIKYEFLADKTVKVYEDGQLIETSTYNTVERDGKIYLTGLEDSGEFGFEINEFEVIFDGNNKVSFKAVINNISIDHDGNPSTPQIVIPKMETTLKLSK